MAIELKYFIRKVLSDLKIPVEFLVGVDQPFVEIPLKHHGVTDEPEKFVPLERPEAE
jgi:hypothetical protein